MTCVFVSECMWGGAVRACAPVAVLQMRAFRTCGTKSTEHEGTLDKCKKKEQAIACTKALTGGIVESIEYGRLMKLIERTNRTKCDN